MNPDAISDSLKKSALKQLGQIDEVLLLIVKGLQDGSESAASVTARIQALSETTIAPMRKSIEDAAQCGG